MDSMLDTLTNVVGILLIVLVTVQLSSQEAASRIAAAVQQLEPGAAERLAEEAAEARAAADRAEVALERQLAAAKQDPAKELARLEAEAARAEKTATESAARAAGIEREKSEKSAAARAAAEAAGRKAAAERAKAEADVKQVEQRRQAVVAELSKTEKPIPPPAKEVRLPDPRPAPANAKDLRVLCREGRLWVIDPTAVQAQVLKRATFIIRQKKLDPDGDNWLTDGAALATEFNKEPVRADDCKVTMAVSGDAFTLALARMPGSGQPVEQSVKPLGDLGKALRRFTPADHYVRFFVWPDGFEAYLEARAVAAEREFAAGWEPMGSPDEYRMGFYSLRVGKKPPPAAPASPASKQPAQNVVD
jgi:hypothetical protein